jgi:hypothetical protein
MVVRFVCVIRVPVCARVSRVCPVCPGSPRCLFTGTCKLEVTFDVLLPVRSTCDGGCWRLECVSRVHLNVCKQANKSTQHKYLIKRNRVPQFAFACLLNVCERERFSRPALRSRGRRTAEGPKTSGNVFTFALSVAQEPEAARPAGGGAAGSQVHRLCRAQPRVVRGAHPRRATSVLLLQLAVRRDGVDAARGRDPAFRRARFAHPTPGRPHQQAKLLCPLKLYGQAKLLQDSLLRGLRD